MKLIARTVRDVTDAAIAAAVSTSSVDFATKRATIVASCASKGGKLAPLTNRMARAVALGLCLAMTLAATIGLPARADDYPQRTVTFVVPYPPGGGTDILTRMLAQELQDKLKQPFVIENRPGGGTLVAAAAVAKSAPDGYTLFLAPVTALAIIPAVYKSLPYDPIKDFEAVGLVGAAQFVLVASPSLGVNTLAELVALVKSKPPGEMSYASAGAGTPHHVFMEMFLKMAGLKMQHVPYRGSLAALTDMLSGIIPLMIVDVAPALPMIREGKLKAIAVPSPRRVDVLPDIPTIAEAGIPGYSASGWFAVVARAGTSRSIVNRLNQVLMAHLRRPDVHDTLQSLGIQALTSTPDEVNAHIAAELRKWRQVIKDTGISAEGI